MFGSNSEIKSKMLVIISEVCKIYKLDCEMSYYTSMTKLVSELTANKEWIFCVYSDDVLYGAVDITLLNDMKERTVILVENRSDVYRQIESILSSYELPDDQKIEKKGIKYAEFKIGRKKVQIIPSNIEYLEVRDHICEIHYFNTVIRITQSLTELLKIFGCDFIYRCHSGYAVNFNKVVNIENDGFVLESGVKIPFSHNKRLLCRTDYNNYIQKSRVI